MALFFLLLLLELDDGSLELEPAAVPLSLAEFDFWPERACAGVLVAFSCESPDELMCDCALSSPVGFEEDVARVSLELVPDEEVLGLEAEALPLFIEALPFVEALPFIDELLDGELL